jgi:hypothetical protein
VTMRQSSAGASRSEQKESGWERLSTGGRPRSREPIAIQRAALATLPGYCGKFRFSSDPYCTSSTK